MSSRIERKAKPSPSEVATAVTAPVSKPAEAVETAVDFFVHDELHPGEKQNLLKLAQQTREREAGRPSVPLNLARNAHLTNTHDELKGALRGSYHWMEGDVRLQGGARRIPGPWQRVAIMAHDITNVRGLTLKDWLDVGKQSGRSLKLDMKQAAALPEIVQALKASGIPDDQLMLNADVIGEATGLKGAKLKVSDLLEDRYLDVKQLKQLRKQFPNAIIAIGTYGGSGEFSEKTLKRLAAAAEEVGGKIMFPLRAERVTPEVVRTLSPAGAVGIWNSPFGSNLKTEEEAAKEAEKFRAWGCQGVIDLRLKFGS